MERPKAKALGYLKADARRTEVKMRSGLVLAVVLMTCGAAWGQAAVQTTAPGAAKGPAFETISIKPNNSGSRDGTWGMTGRTFRGRNVTIASLLMGAYFPTGSRSMDRIKGLPSWAADEHYDVMATVDDATAESWKGLPVPQQTVKAEPLVLAMLMERCKLTAHKVPTEISGYELRVGKGGPKMKAYVDGEPLPPHALKPGGDWMVVPLIVQSDADPKPKVVRYLNMSMPELTELMSHGGLPMIDKTGLAGKYDLELPIHMPERSADGTAPAAPMMMDDPALTLDWGAVGLEINAVKVPAENVVVDHVERPSVN